MTTSTLERINNTTETVKEVDEETRRELGLRALAHPFGPAKLASNFAESIKRSEELSPIASNY